eukprot:CAMPEP_0115321380 /NCGR_PEP_ID=MMETSP0270-20121206/80828_1 /TAXON_ID=71861 /ORGANISM="Scrippsiella trochoidea, Strain CCMP3099" /LENGTH=209 /DNA_ID=CAMNT_0002741255 /DNA_START=330 /DNA_END=956 /DNA_ORIENTATION=-
MSAGCAIWSGAASLEPLTSRSPAAARSPSPALASRPPCPRPGPAATVRRVPSIHTQERLEGAQGLLGRVRLRLDDQAGPHGVVRKVPDEALEALLRRLVVLLAGGGADGQRRRGLLPLPNLRLYHRNGTRLVRRAVVPDDLLVHAAARMRRVRGADPLRGVRLADAGATLQYGLHLSSRDPPTTYPVDLWAELDSSRGPTTAKSSTWAS